jgi:ABC-type amino acid transport substrate-binding protein/heat shock protein HslJ
MSGKTDRKGLIILVGIVAGIWIIGCAVIAGFYIFRNAPSQTPAVSPLASQPAEDSWTRIQTAGKMVVATSGDYPPFAFYNSQYQLDGFDVALLTEIGVRLNMPIELKDIAFDGLGNAIQLGQIDLAAAALSITPDRQAAFDFSNAYYGSSTSVLANQNSPLTSITSPDQIVSLRTGVQNKTVFQSWIQQNLVDTGKMPASNLFTYQRTDDAVNDLKAGRVDVVILDLSAANAFVAAGGVKLVGQDLNQQLYGIAMAKGAATLQTHVNNALTQIQNDGTLAALTQKYFSQSGEGIQPQPTPVPSQPTPTPAACIDGMSFVQDLTYPDYHMTNPPTFYPGTEFQKGWKIQNTGTCAWDVNYILVYVGGNTSASSMGGQPTAVNTKVNPGVMYDMYVNLVAPLQTGTYQGFWQMRNPLGQYFGDRIWVGIQVVPPPGQPTAVPQPVIQRFSASPAQITAGGAVTVQWEVLGEVSNIEILRDNTTLWVNAPATGSFTDYPPSSGVIYYQIQASNAGGTALASNPVNVSEAPPTIQPTSTQPPPSATPAPTTTPVPTQTLAPTATPVPTQPPVAPPVITSFVVQPGEIKVGECVNVSWSVSGDVQVVRLLRNTVVIVDNAPITGSGQDCFQNSGTEVYRLEAVGVDGSTASQEQSVTIKTNDINLVLASYLNSQGLIVPVLSGTKVTAVLGSDNAMTGSAGCNTYSTTYQVNGSNVTIAPPSVGRMVCSDPQGIMEQENAYIAALTQATGFQVSGDQLELTMKTTDPVTNSEVVVILLVFRRVY